MQPELNLPPAELRLKDDQIWDRLRKKYVLLTPEEWVRQNFVHYMIEHLGYSEGLLMSEKMVEYAGQKKRCDIVLFDPQMKARIIVECKAPSITLNEDTFYQIAKYNSVLQADYLILTNGLQHYCAKVDYEAGKMTYLSEIPSNDKLS